MPDLSSLFFFSLQCNEKISKSLLEWTFKVTYVADSYLSTYSFNSSLACTSFERRLRYTSRSRSTLFLFTFKAEQSCCEPWMSQNIEGLLSWTFTILYGKGNNLNLTRAPLEEGIKKPACTQRLMVATKGNIKLQNLLVATQQEHYIFLMQIECLRPRQSMKISASVSLVITKSLSLLHFT